MQESPFLPASDAIRRGIKLAKDALVKQGYEVVDFRMSQDEYRASVDLFLGMMVNGNSPFMVEDFEGEGEAFMRALQDNKTILYAGFMKRWLIDTLLKLSGRERVCRILDAARLLTMR